MHTYSHTYAHAHTHTICNRTLTYRLSWWHQVKKLFRRTVDVADAPLPQFSQFIRNCAATYRNTIIADQAASVFETRACPLPCNGAGCQHVYVCQHFYLCQRFVRMSVPYPTICLCLRFYRPYFTSFLGNCFSHSFSAQHGTLLFPRHLGRLFREVTITCWSVHLSFIFHTQLFVYTTPHRLGEALLTLLSEHIVNNVVQIGGKFYRQSCGISQVSLVNSAVCSFCTSTHIWVTDYDKRDI